MSEIVEEIDGQRVVMSKYFKDQPQPPPPPPEETEDFVPDVPPPLPTGTSCPPITLPSTQPPLIVFDTETTGFKPAIICELAYFKFECGQLVKTYDELFQLPVGVKIEERACKTHGITEKDCTERGVDPVAALEAFAVECSNVLLNGGRIVGHNVGFDVRAVRETRAAHCVIEFGDNQDLDVKDTFCTQRVSRKYSNLKDKANRTKAFSNSELYEFLYGQKPVWARLHSAFDDIKVTALNYAEGIVRGWW
jgi:DNA polymerase III epsilon subunit-like protein